MQFFVGEVYINHNGHEQQFVVAEISDEGRKGLLRTEEGGELLLVRDEIMQTGKWKYGNGARFEVGKHFESVTNPGHRALVAQVKNEGRMGLIRFVNEQAERFRGESWFAVNDLLGSGEWRLPRHEG